MDDSNKVAARIQKESPSATDDPSTAAKKPCHDVISSLKDEYESIIIPYAVESTDQSPLEKLDIITTDEDNPVKSKPPTAEKNYLFLR